VRGRSALTFCVPLVALVLAYQLGPASVLDVGSALDGPFLQGFHGSEATADYTYRWSQGEARATLWGLPGLAHVQVTARLSGFRPSGEPALFSVAVDRQAVALKASQDLEVVTLGEGTTDFLGNITVHFNTDTFNTPSDPRRMGLKVDWIKAQPASGPFLPAPPLAAAMAALGLSWLSSRVRWRKWIYLVISALSLTWLMLGQAVVALAVAVLGTVAGVVCYAASHREKIAFLLGSLESERVAARILLVGMAIWTGFALWVVVHSDFIGHADYADNAVVARNLVNGKGMVTDYVAQFYRQYPEVSHPADTWPPLQPILIAVAFCIFGISTWGAKIPNLLIMVALGFLIYRWTKQISSPMPALFAVAALLTHDYLFSGVVYPLNDVVFTLLVLIFLRGCLSMLEPGHLRPWLAVMQGIVLAAMTLAKPSGLLFGFSLFVPLALQIRRGRVAWRIWVLMGAVAIAVYLPWAIRNLLAFGLPFYSTEAHDAFVLRYRPPWENIYRIYWDNPPGLRDFLKMGWDLWLQTTWDELRNLWSTLVSGKVIPPVILAMAVGGALTLRNKEARLLWVALPGFAAYLGFIVSYWHVETRYFMPLVPLLIIWAAYFLKQLGQMASRPVALVIAPAALVITLYFQGSNIVNDSLKYYMSPTAIVEAANWARDNLPRDAVVMTRNPWEFTFHSELRTVMIPTGTGFDAALVAQTYGARYLQLDHLSNPIRPYLAPLYKGREPTGFSLVYRNADVLIYAFDDSAIAVLMQGRLE
jgi:hypothetical protein